MTQSDPRMVTLISMITKELAVGEHLVAFCKATTKGPSLTPVHTALTVASGGIVFLWLATSLRVNLLPLLPLLFGTQIALTILGPKHYLLALTNTQFLLLHLSLTNKHLSTQKLAYTEILAVREEKASVGTWVHLRTTSRGPLVYHLLPDPKDKERLGTFLQALHMSVPESGA